MSEHTSTNHGPLGQQTAYASSYDPGLLFPIARAETRASLGLNESALPFYGTDLWTGYEVSWLDECGKPIVAVAQFRLPCTSPNLIESKSFKLYLNSYNQSRFAGQEQVRAQMIQDLSAAAGANVSVQLEPVADAQLPIAEAGGECIDALPVTIEHYHPAPELLSTGAEWVEERLHSHLLKSNCPVTGQPDWATVEIHYRGPKIEREGLLKYVVSFREHQDFHEHCVERMFVDLQARCQPEFLTVFARYTRRGGLDINPWRSSAPGPVPGFERLVRQ